MTFVTWYSEIFHYYEIGVYVSCEWTTASCRAVTDLGLPCPLRGRLSFITEGTYAPNDRVRVGMSCEEDLSLLHEVSIKTAVVRI